MTKTIPSKTIRDAGMNGDPEQAISEVLARCKTNPENGDGWVLLSTLYGQAGQFSDAIAAAETAVNLLPENIDAHTNLANALAAEGKPERALKHYEAALRISPGNPAILTNFAIAHLRAGKTEDGISLLRDIVSKHPRFVAAHFQLANFFFALHDFKEAEEFYRNVIAIQPDHHCALSQLGLCLANSGRHDSAETCLRRATSLSPQNTDYLLQLGAICLERGNIPGGIHFLQHAYNASPDQPETCCALADALVAAARLEEALGLYRRARTFSPHYAKASEGEAGILVRLNQTDEAYLILRSLIQSESLGVSGARLYARICLRKGDCAEASHILSTFTDDPGGLPHDKIVAHFALGDLYDKLERYDEAFLHYNAGNQMQNYVYNREADKRYVEDMLHTFSPASYKKLPRSGVKTRRPVFILGMPRSGTTLLEQMLANHPDIAGAGELENIDLFTKELQNSSGYPTSLAGLNKSTVEKLSKSYLKKLDSISPNSMRVTDKMPANFRHIPLIRLLFPKAYIIHCTRDPLDTCLSNYFQRFNASQAWATRLTDIAFYYRLYRKCMNYWSGALRIEFMEVNYEQLVTSQEATVRAILDYIGVSWNESCLDFYNSTRAVATASVDQVRQPLYTNSIKRWNHYAKHLQVPGLVELMSDETEPPVYNIFKPIPSQ